MWSLVGYYVIAVCLATPQGVKCERYIDSSRPIVMQSNMTEQACSEAIEAYTDAIPDEGTNERSGMANVVRGDPVEYSCERES